MDFLQKITKLPFGVVLRATDSFLYPIVDDYVLLLTELVNLEALVLNRLLITAYSDVTVNHIHIESKSSFRPILHLLPREGLQTSIGLESTQK